MNIDERIKKIENRIKKTKEYFLLEELKIKLEVLKELKKDYYI